MFKSPARGLTKPHYNWTVGNGSEIPSLTRQDLIDRGILVSDDKINEGLTTAPIPPRLKYGVVRQWMHTSGSDDGSSLYRGEPDRLCGYCAAEVLHSEDLHVVRVFTNTIRLENLHMEAA